MSLTEVCLYASMIFAMLIVVSGATLLAPYLMMLMAYPLIVSGIINYQASRDTIIVTSD